MADGNIRDIVNVTIDRRTQAVTRQGFGTLLVAGAFTTFPERVRYYTNAAALITDGFLATDAVYLAVAAAFAQSPAEGRAAAADLAVAFESVAERVNPAVVQIQSTRLLAQNERGGRGGAWACGRWCASAAASPAPSWCTTSATTWTTWCWASPPAQPPWASTTGASSC